MGAQGAYRPFPAVSGPGSLHGRAGGLAELLGHSDAGPQAAARGARLEAARDLRLHICPPCPGRSSSLAFPTENQFLYSDFRWACSRLKACVDAFGTGQCADARASIAVMKDQIVINPADKTARCEGVTLSLNFTLPCSVPTRISPYKTE